MAGEERRAPPDLTRLSGLSADPTKYGFYRAMRLIEATWDDRPRLGGTRRPSQDPVRLGQEVSLAFPPSTISDFKPMDGEKPAVLQSRFFGLFGPNGPLPLHLTEYARDRLRNDRDPTLVAFADMFHHRMFSLFYRAWAAGEPTASFDRPDRDPFGDYVAALAGVMGEAMVSRDRMPDLSKRHFAGIMGSFRKTEIGLLAMLSSFFRAPAEITSFIGSWLELAPEDCWKLGEPARLGSTAAIGSRVWTRQAKFRIRLGPMGLAEYERLLPGGASLEKLAALVRNYIGDELDWDVNLVLKADEAPPTELGRKGKLGWTTWLGARPEGRDADDLHLNPLKAA